MAMTVLRPVEQRAPVKAIKWSESANRGREHLAMDSWEKERKAQRAHMSGMRGQYPAVLLYFRNPKRIGVYGAEGFVD